MGIRKLPWRFLLPGAIFSVSIVTWVQYNLSVRASDDSPPVWYWYGNPVSAWLNFPAFIYSLPANALFKMGFKGVKLGRVLIHPQIVAFFLLVLAFWYWVGKKTELWATPKGLRSGAPEPRPLVVALYGMGAALWLFITPFEVHDAVVAWLWLHHSPIVWDREAYACSEALWSVVLAAYYSRSFARSVRAKIFR